ncbi:uncharacterized protein PGTG_20893 [Puccinia graminis f. sp. tritici CRL 75-36-700-3]|uniref:Uncharacterized protein n=1 Tax=Puccinia graminis f. sp. tritici (strain CRL 75-36-700-3 / race SCCL) TaxID=418459 RepID=H6QPH4_PUCGT|nr:uncharacterized protein PGTG_20893 [Puccinia graminis f. sp. tritici CRL 75-36-700-3]EHS63912.1 hypothetical protein PGTG_20893 [Puccinia graminis f. sp. tritici CRL 75-36-700-3]
MIDPIGDRPAHPQPLNRPPVSKPAKRKRKNKPADNVTVTTQPPKSKRKKQKASTTPATNSTEVDSSHHPSTTRPATSSTEANSLHHPSTIRPATNLPEVDGHHQQSAASLNQNMVDHLEAAADELSQTQPLQSNQSAPANLLPRDRANTSDLPPPLDIFNEPVPRKQTKKLRTRAEDGLADLPAPRPYEELMKESIGTLIAEAQERSKGAMSQDDHEFFAEFYQEQRKTLAIKAIERAVSVSMVDNFIGRRIPLRELTGWNKYMKTPEAREVFQGAGKGVGQSDAMSRVSALRKAAQAKGSNGQTDADGTSQNERGSNELTPAELALDNDEEAISENTRPNDKQGGGVGKRAAVSLSLVSDRVESFLEDWLEKAKTMAISANCDMIMIAVSNHLGPHSFQFVKKTHGAIPFVKHSDDMDGMYNYAARFQSYNTGHGAEYIAELAEGLEKDPSRPITVPVRMARLIAKKTQGIIKKWPWKDNTKRLKKMNYRLVVHPDLRTPIEYITSPSRGLSPADIRRLHLDLDDHFIDVVEIDNQESSSARSLQSRDQVTPQSMPINDQESTRSSRIPDEDAPGETDLDDYDDSGDES